MVRDADEHAQEDRSTRERVEARNNADSLLYSTRKSMTEYGKALSDSDRDTIDRSMKALEAALDDADTATLKSLTEALAAAAQKLGEAVYSKNGNEQPEASAGGTTAGGAEDADFEVVDDKAV